ncbi:MAG: chorismate synthase [Bacteroidota bacterium]|nr:chorismate synthase [Bacteroidota bacterium]
MAGNSTGNLFRLSSFGESHGPAIGGMIDGCPPNLEIDLDFIRNELFRRRTNSANWASGRAEPDEVEFLSGLKDGKSTGTPIAFIIRNQDARPQDYDKIREVYRPSHADYTYQQKYGIRDHRGGGRASARETAVRVVGGAVARLYLLQYDIRIMAYVSAIGKMKLDIPYADFDPAVIEESPVRCPDQDLSIKMTAFLEKIREEEDSIGGIVSCKVKGVPAGLGEPVYEKLNAKLASALMSINAAKGVDFGLGFAGVGMKGSEHNDEFVQENGRIKTRTNHSGGIQGGISNGMELNFSLAFKPPSSIGKTQDSVDLNGNLTKYKAGGRHDACIVPRAVPIVEAMAALVLADHYLLFRGYQ